MKCTLKYSNECLDSITRRCLKFQLRKRRKTKSQWFKKCHLTKSHQTRSLIMKTTWLKNRLGSSSQRSKRCAENAALLKCQTVTTALLANAVLPGWTTTVPGWTTALVTLIKSTSFCFWFTYSLEVSMLWSWLSGSVTRVGTAIVGCLSKQDLWSLQAWASSLEYSSISL